MEKETKCLIITVSILFGAGIALSVVGFFGIIGAFFSFTWLRMVAAVAAFASGLTMVFIANAIDDQEMLL